MTEPDELISKADALLSRWRANSVAPSPPEDYPVLTEIVEMQAPVTPQDDPPGPWRDLPAEPAMPDIGVTQPEPGSSIELPVLESEEAPALESAVGITNANGMDAALAPEDELPILPEVQLLADELDPHAPPTEEQLCERVLELLEPRLAECVQEALCKGMEEIQGELARRITSAMHQNIDAMIREAVASAVRQESLPGQDLPGPGR